MNPPIKSPALDLHPNRRDARLGVNFAVTGHVTGAHASHNPYLSFLLWEIRQLVSGWPGETKPGAWVRCGAVGTQVDVGWVHGLLCMGFRSAPPTTPRPAVRALAGGGTRAVIPEHGLKRTLAPRLAARVKRGMVSCIYPGKG